MSCGLSSSQSMKICFATPLLEKDILTRPLANDPESGTTATYPILSPRVYTTYGKNAPPNYEQLADSSCFSIFYRLYMEYQYVLFQCQVQTHYSTASSMQKTRPGIAFGFGNAVERFYSAQVRFFSFIKIFLLAT